MVSAALAVAERRLQRVAGLVAALQRELSREYMFFDCECGESVHSATSSYCGQCGRKLDAANVR